MVQLITPHISLGCSVDEGLAILQTLGYPVHENNDRELQFKVNTPLFALAVYPKNGIVGSVWYDDPTGRQSEAGRAEKVDAYLNRYGSAKNWELRLENAWMRYWFNAIDGAQMVYGIDRDVIRFNQYAEGTVH